ncbi:tyrosine-type recombinase/integrase [Nesterenkonia suensis]
MGRPGLRIGERGKITYLQLDDGSWRARCYYRDGRGIRRELTVREPTKGKATTALKAKWHRKSQDIFNGRLGGEGVTFAQVFDSWFEHLEKKSRRTGHPRLRSINDDRYVVKNHVLPVAGNWAMDEITVGKLNELLWSIPTIDGRLMATARRVQTILSRACAYAVAHELLPFNMGRETERIQYKAPEPSVISAEDLAEVREVFRRWCDHPTHERTPILDIIDVMLATGCRISEVLALSWDKVHLDDEVPWILVDAGTNYEPGKGLYIDTTKSGKALRIALPTFATIILRRRLDARTDSDFVFHTATGRPYYLSSVERSVKYAMADADHLSHVWNGGFRSHSLRKTVITAVERRHGLAAAARQAGHSDEYTTRKFYVAPNLETIDYTGAIESIVKMEQPVLADAA